MFGFRYIEQESAREDGPLQDRFLSLRSGFVPDQEGVPSLVGSYLSADLRVLGVVEPRVFDS